MLENINYPIIIIFLATYLIAAVPSGYWLGLACGKNLLTEGSGSTGATNVLRVVGKWQAALVFFFDIFKGFAPIYYVKSMSPFYNEFPTILFLVLTMTPIIAHSKSIYIGFKGGKSSATGLGVLLALNPVAALITISIWAGVVFTTKISSLGSIVAVPLAPVWLWAFGEDLATISFGVIAFVYIVLIKHRSNIARLLRGEENSFKKKEESS